MPVLSRSPLLRLAVWALCLPPVLGLPAPAAAQEGGPPIVVRVNDQTYTHAALLARGREVLASGDYDEAATVFRAGLEAARSRGDQALQATYLFNLGLTSQTRARLDAAPAALREAERHYRQLIELDPASGAARNNLAQLFAQSGRAEAAAEQYERAIALGDDRQAFYALNYAQLLERTGDGATAIRYYELARGSQPDHPAVHEGLVRLYGAHDVSRLAAYLWRLVYGGQEIRGTETALALLGRTEWPGVPASAVAELKRVLLTQVAVGLSRQYYDPAAFEQTPAGAALRRLAADADVGPGAAALVHLHTSGPASGEETAPSSFQWWDRGNEFEDPPQGVWPREGFRTLAHALGDWHVQHQDTMRAEAYYRLALNLSPAEMDLEALLRLTDLYFASGHTAGIEQLIRDHSARLYEGKSAAYRRGLWKAIFEYHRALGTVYALLERWGNAATVTSAIFQLEHARDAAREYNERPVAPGDTLRLRFDPFQVELLARAYGATGQALRAFRLRLEMADEYLKAGETPDAARLLAPLEGAGLPADASARDRARYEALQAALAPR